MACRWLPSFRVFPLCRRRGEPLMHLPLLVKDINHTWIQAPLSGSYLAANYFPFPNTASPGGEASNI